jgi:hypothetical protein
VDGIESIKECMPYLRPIIADQKIYRLAKNADTQVGQQSIQSISHQVCASVIASSCNINTFDEDTKRLFLTITLDETEEQTKRVIENQLIAETFNGHAILIKQESIKQIHRNVQQLLKPLSVCFPNELSIKYPTSCLHNRRDMTIFISLVKTIAVLHQYQRSSNDGIVYVEQSDIETAIELSKEAFAIAHDELSPQARVLLTHIQAHVNEKLTTVYNDKEISISDITFSRREVRLLCGWSETYSRTIFSELLRQEYIGKVSGKQGLKYSYVLLDQNENIAELHSDFALKAS